MAWASKTYGSFIQVINAGSVFFINFGAIGAFLIIAHTQHLEFWDPRVLFGFLVGSSLAYYLKGSASYASMAVAENMTESKIMDQI